VSEDPARHDTLADAVRLDRSEFVRTEFLDRVAHELRGPAGVTLGALDELELALGDAAEAHRPLLAMARRGAFKVLRTADRLTRTAQLEAGVKFSPVPTDLRDVVRRSCVDASRVEERSKVRLEIALPEAACDLPLDAGWVQAAITELIAQALHLARREVTVQILGNCTVLITSDGAAQQVLPSTQRFERRADRRDAGLAIPLAREVAHAHGGEFSIEASESGMRVRIAFGALP
jgi:signal transduction histidine kinase